MITDIFVEEARELRLKDGLGCGHGVFRVHACEPTYHKARIWLAYPEGGVNADQLRKMAQLLDLQNMKEPSRRIEQGTGT